jgi:biotin operon repressor
MHRGYVKLWRKLKEWDWFKDSETLHLFIYMLITANYKSTYYQGIEIKRGELITGRLQLSKDLGISEQSIRTSINRLKSTSEITSRSTNKYTIITLCNYENYQCENNENNQQNVERSTNDQPAINQQLTTSKELKNEKNEKNNKDRTDIFYISTEAMNAEKTWRTSFDIYKKIVVDAEMILITDATEMVKQNEFNPGIDIKKSISKAIHNFWGTETGWKHCKKSKSKAINMRQTLINAISMPSNRVYKQREISFGQDVSNHPSLKPF